MARFRAATHLILGLETSCDETAAAVITQDGQILANVISSQADLHARYGGVVPEVASRRHLELVTPVLREALGDAGAELDDPEALAVLDGGIDDPDGTGGRSSGARPPGDGDEGWDLDG